MDKRIINKESQKKFELKSMGLDSEFDSGNLMKAEQVDDFNINLWIAPDCANTQYEKQYRTWFYFKAIPNQNTNNKEYYKFTIKNMINQKHLYNAGMTPVYKTGNTWSPLTTQIEFTVKENTKNEHELTFIYRFESSQSVFFAFTYPWSYQEDQEYLDSIEQKLNNNPDLYFQRELITYSLNGLKIELLTITDQTNKSGQSFAQIKGLFPLNTQRPQIFLKKKYIFISARVHPGEIPGSHVLKGMLAYLSQNTPQVKTLLKNTVIMIIPMINPDGVQMGNYRVDSLGQNLNRFYSSPCPLIHPSVFAIKHLFIQLHQTTQLYFYMDLHAHAGKKGIFSFGNHLPFPQMVNSMLYNRLLAMNNKDYDYQLCDFSERNMRSHDKSDMLSKEGTGRVAIYKLTGLTHCYTLECNYNMGRQINTLGSLNTLNTHKTDHHRLSVLLNKTPQLAQIVTQQKTIQVNNSDTPYTVQDYMTFGADVFITLLDLMAHDNYLQIQHQHQHPFISRISDSVYTSYMVLKYQIAFWLITQMPYRFDSYLRKFMKVLPLDTNSNTGIQSVQMNVSQFQLLELFEKYLEEGIKTQLTANRQQSRQKTYKPVVQNKQVLVRPKPKIQIIDLFSQGFQEQDNKLNQHMRRADTVQDEDKLKKNPQMKRVTKQSTYNPRNRELKYTSSNKPIQ